MTRDGRLVLLTGATGYVGGRLLEELEASGVPVRCLARHPESLRARVGPGTEIARGDVLDPPSLATALRGVDAAYYLVHSMGSAGSFVEADRRAAENFGAAARAAGVRRIIYLGGLADAREPLSPHLKSRHEVGAILRSSGVPVLEFRASIILGSGSLSFEMIRALVERLPVLITPRWVSVPTQPIAIQDVLGYLLAARDHPVDGHRIYEIGGRSCVAYGDLMREYARQRGLRRLIIPVPVLTPRLSSLWLGLVTPLYVRVGRELIESIRHPTVVRDDAARREFAIEPLGHREAIAAALRPEDRGLPITRRDDASRAVGHRPDDGATAGQLLFDSRVAGSAVPPAAAFAPIRRIGGATGWYSDNWLWQLRGLIDRMCGGVGLRRGRRDPESLMVGDTVDCWRVEAFEPDRRMLLRAEMKLPGRAWLEFTVEPTPEGSRIRQTAVFEPTGLAGRAYWYLISPLHQRVFAGMLRGIVDAGRAASGPGPAPRPASPGPPVLQQWAVLLGLLAICFGAAAIGASLTVAPVRDWYPTLRKPAWTPPDWVFGPVWTILYALMALSAWLVWRRGGWAGSRTALGWFTGQLVLNAAWSGLFFALHRPGTAFAEILLLWCAIAATLRSFWRISTLAAGLLVPYLLWVTFAAVLNGALWRMNS